MTLKEIEKELESTTIPTSLSSPKDGAVLIVPKGSMDMVGAHKMQTVFSQVIEIGYLNAIIDMSGISYAASMGIGAIINFSNELAKKKGQLIMMNIQPKVLDVFSLLGFTQFLTIADSLDKAIKAI